VRSETEVFFQSFLRVAQPRWVTAQTNDPFLYPLAKAYAPTCVATAVLFAEGGTTSLAAPDVILRPVAESEHATIFRHTSEPIGTWGLEQDKHLVATGGLFFHYNPPYGDVYMEVADNHRRQGLGSYLVQELKRICRTGDCVPAARCDCDNTASRRTLGRAGMTVCGQIVRGPIAA
jgi:GNAT superfamily N-acetyltransferase